MNWLFLFVAGLFEVGWAVGLKFTDGFTRLWPSAGTVAAMIASLALLGIAMKSLPMATAYAVWVGVGVIGTATVGILFLGEPTGTLRIVSLALITAGIIGMKVAASG